MYSILCGFPPFYSDNDERLLELIAKGEYGLELVDKMNSKYIRVSRTVVVLSF